jgi:hypothetical protein
VRAGAEHSEAERRQNRETLRLLYVGWTRARDRLVLTGRSGKVIGDTLGLLKDGKGVPLICEPKAECEWGGRPVTMKIREVAPADGVPSAPAAGAGYAAAGPREFPPATRVVSSVAVTGSLGESEVLTAVPFVQVPVDWAALGSAVHAFFAGDRPGLEGRLGMAEDLLARWGVQGSMRADALLAASDALHAWASRRWPQATWHREWPVRALEPNGTELTGYADLVLMGKDSFVLVDHKCLSGTREAAQAGCAQYAGQLGAYADVIARATGKRSAGCFIHLVTQGVIAAVADRPR